MKKEKKSVEPKQVPDREEIVEIPEANEIALALALVNQPLFLASILRSIELGKIFQEAADELKKKKKLAENSK